MTWDFLDRLENDVVVLERAERRHAPGLARDLDPNWFDYFLSLAPDPLDADGVAAYMERHYFAPNIQPYVVVERASGELVGMTSFLDIVERDLRLEIGMTWYRSSHRGTRVNPAAKLALLTDAFERLGCERVQLKTDARNLHSQAAIAKLGAVREGLLRGYGRQPNGYVRDAVMFSILRREWPRVKERLVERVA